MIKKLYQKYKTQILYVLFGALTTLVNMAVYFVCKRVFYINTAASNIIAWALSVVFAFITNKRYVFDNSNNHKALVQFGEFVGARLLSGALDTVIMVVFVDMLCWFELPVKILSNVLVIIFNYIASKFFIFK